MHVVISNQEKIRIGREKREALKTTQLSLNRNVDLTQQTAAAKAKHAKGLEKNRKSVVKRLLKKGPSSENTTDASRKRKPEAGRKSNSKLKNSKSKNTKDSKSMDNDKSSDDDNDHNSNGPVEVPAIGKKTGLAKTHQGERKVPVPSDKHGCEHSGLLELLPIDRRYLQTYVRVGGWLYRTPCKDCGAKEEDGSHKRVMDVSTLLDLKGKREIGYYCNCGPVGHKMDGEEEPVWKQQWTCTMILCMECYDSRKISMGDEGGKRTRHRKRMDY